MTGTLLVVAFDIALAGTIVPLLAMVRSNHDNNIETKHNYDDIVKCAVACVAACYVTALQHTQHSLQLLDLHTQYGLRLLGLHTCALHIILLNTILRACFYRKSRCTHHHT
jgi:uncharacterized membrane protein YeiB